MANDERGVSDDDHLGASGDARNEFGDESSEEDASGVPIAAPGFDAPAAAGERAHGRALSQSEAELAEELLIGFQRSEWAGPLPPPEILHAYTADEQRKIMAWGDAMILDESERSDRLVDAIIDATKREQWFNFLSAVVPTLAAFVTLLVTRDPLSLSFLAVPGITIAVNVIAAVRGGEGSREE